jgi:hypothetical protein
MRKLAFCILLEQSIPRNMAGERSGSHFEGRFVGLGLVGWFTGLSGCEQEIQQVWSRNMASIAGKMAVETSLSKIKYLQPWSLSNAVASLCQSGNSALFLFCNKELLNRVPIVTTDSISHQVQSFHSFLL